MILFNLSWILAGIQINYFIFFVKIIQSLNWIISFTSYSKFLLVLQVAILAFRFFSFCKINALGYQ